MAFPTTSITIDCDTCSMQHTSTCDDCLVTHICNRDEHTAVVFDFAEERAVRLFAQAGMLPTLRHRAAGS
jgi:hypothetical protein